MRGSLSDRCPAEILSEVLRRQISGVLSFAHAGITRQLSIDAGTMIRFATSTDPAENFTSHLTGAGRLGPDQMRAAMAARQGDEMLGTTLVRLGLLPAAELARATNAHVRRVGLATLLMDEGTWEFALGALPFREQRDSGVRTAEVVLEWSRGLKDIDWVRRRLGPDDRHVKRERRPPEGYQDIRLDSAEGYIMSRVDGATTAREIGMVSPMGDERTLSALLGLSLSGLLERLPGGSAPPIELPEPPSPARAASASGAPAPATSAPTTSAPATSAPVIPAPVAQAPATHASGSYASASSAAAKETIAPPQAATAAAATAAPTATAPAANASPATQGGTPLRLVTPPGGGPKPVGAATAGPAKPGVAKPGLGKPGARLLRPGGKGPARPGAARPTLVPKRPQVPKAGPPTDERELEREMMIRFEQLDALDLYQALGVMRGAPTDEVRRAYYALTRRFHPDKFRREDMKPSAEKVFARITEAYATLSNVEARERYDTEEAAKAGGKQSGPADTTELARLNYRSGREHLERGKLAEALGFFANACQQDPTKSEYFTILGATQARNPRLRKEAEQNLLKAIDLSPSTASPYVHLASLYERAGHPDKAIEIYRDALKWEPENKAAAEALARLAPSKKGLLGLFSRH